MRTEERRAGNADKGSSAANENRESGAAVGVRKWRRVNELLGRREQGAIAQALGLSPREAEVVRGLFDELGEAQIGVALKMSAHTVHAHVRSIHAKLEAHNTAGIVLRFFAKCLEGPERGPWRPRGDAAIVKLCDDGELASAGSPGEASLFR